MDDELTHAGSIDVPREAESPIAEDDSRETRQNSKEADAVAAYVKSQVKDVLGG